MQLWMFDWSKPFEIWKCEEIDSNIKVTADDDKMWSSNLNISQTRSNDNSSLLP